jgi:hypothetical protein
MSDDPADLLAVAVESVTVAMATAFDQIWSKPNARQVMAAFLDGRVRFIVEHDGITTLADPEDGPAAPAPPTGMYL